MFKVEKNLYQTMDRRGAIEYTTGDDDFDEKHVFPILEMQPQMTDFTDCYSNEDIAEDQRMIKSIEHSPDFRHDKGTIPVLAEFLTIHGVDERDWFSSEMAEAYKTSEYDDIVNGVDFVAHMCDPEDPDNNHADIVFGVDVTVSKKDRDLEKKLNREFVNLKKGKRTKLKYFNNLGAEDISRYVIELDPEQVKFMKMIIQDEFFGSEKEEEQLEALIKLEVADELAYQAWRQIRFILLVHTKIPVNEIDTLENITQFLENNMSVVKDELADKSTLLKAVSEGFVILKHFSKVADKIESEIKDEEGRLPSLPHGVKFLTSFTFEDRLVSSKRRFGR